MSVFNSNSVIITGASGGIGFATILACIEHDWHVFAACRNADGLNEKLDEHFHDKNQSYLKNITLLEYDVTDSEAVKRAFKRIQSHESQLIGLINCAGVMRDASLVMQTNDMFDEQMRVNVTASFTHLQFASRLMMRNKQGSIVNLSSVVGIEGAAGQIAYSSSKAAVIGMTKSAAKELAPYNIRVNAVAPGFIETQMTDTYDAEKQQSIVSNIALKRKGSAKEVASFIAQLLKTESAYITGQVIKIDGMMSV